MDEQQPVPPRVRLQALLAIPERQRTDAQWDEINELEIMLAAGNRQGAPQQGNRGQNPNSGGQARQGGGQNQDRKSSRKFHHRPPRRNGP